MRASSRRLSIRFSLFGLCLLLVSVVLFRGFFEQALHWVQRPLVQAGTWVSNWTPFFQQGRFSPERVRTLEDQLIALAFDRLVFEQLERENADLKQTLRFRERQDFESVMASIISRSYTTNVSLFTIDRGRDDGIRVGDPVIVREGILVGKVSETTSKSSTISALTDPSVATAVSVLHQSQTIGVAEGITGNLLRLKFIPQDAAISPNDLVISSGLESTIPAGLLIGLVNDVHPEVNVPFLEAIIEPLADMRQFSTVHVLIQNPL